MLSAQSLSAAEQGQSPYPCAGQDKPPPTPNCLLLLHMRASRVLHAWDTLAGDVPSLPARCWAPSPSPSPSSSSSSQQLPAPVGIAAHLSDIRTLQIPGVFLKCKMPFSAAYCHARGFLDVTGM